MSIDDMIREAVAAGSQVHVWREADGCYASVRHRNGVHHSSTIHSDPVVALRSVLTEDERKRRDLPRAEAAARDPAQIDLEDAIAAVDFGDMLG
ncbi:hypothetical protein [Sphingomonas sp. TREG-RG-20F-R18-01]|uniref:hypothetical protein n=1 Tax=Sphingomonas sp. TREG-RG-20F-R18-01 TaxID=2914982 RepID=UPI001F57F6DD|nr:hypothetical protein [Sphingomonas sp. TREG-RG-20F-R18-01]